MIPEIKDNKKYSYADYLTWTGEERFELIYGEAWSMSPAPTPRHQRVATILTSEIYLFLKGKSCEIFPAPFDVRFVKEKDQQEQDIFITLQPDLSVICDKSKIDDKGCLGSPDLIIEILSPEVAWASSELANDQPSTGYKDETQKLSIYEEYKVKEYWIINPDRKIIQIFLYNGEEFDKPDYYKGNDVINSTVLKGMQVALKDIFS